MYTIISSKISAFFFSDVITNCSLHQVFAQVGHDWTTSICRVTSVTGTTNFKWLWTLVYNICLQRSYFRLEEIHEASREQQ
jgi:DNA-binding HxlR family transcriptional regulator